MRRPARGDQGDGVLVREHAGEAGRRVELAQAVADQRLRLDPPAPPEASPGAYSTAKRAGWASRSVAFSRSAARRRPRVAQVSSRGRSRPPRCGTNISAQAVELAAEDRLGRGRGRAPSPGTAPPGRGRGRDRPLAPVVRRRRRASGRCRSSAASASVADSRRRHRRCAKCAPAGLERVRDVGQIGEARARVPARGGRRAGRRGVAGRPRRSRREERSCQVRRAAGAAGAGGGRLLEDDVRVGAADAERADARAPRRPRGQGASAVAT